MAMAVIYFIRNHSWFASFDASTGKLIFFLAWGYETLSDCCSGQAVDRRGCCALPDKLRFRTKGFGVRNEADNGNH
jgi:hypothetical protein